MEPNPGSYRLPDGFCFMCGMPSEWVAQHTEHGGVCRGCAEACIEVVVRQVRRPYEVPLERSEIQQGRLL